MATDVTLKSRLPAEAVCLKRLFKALSRALHHSNPREAVGSSLAIRIIESEILRHSARVGRLCN